MITRQYTPPTCTLAVMARSPLMARLLKQPVLEDFEFNLRFDDPRLTEAEYIRVKGDRPQLEQLYQTVTAYVEILLRFPPQIDGLMGRIQGSQDILSVSSGKFLNSIPAGSSPDLIARGSKQGLQNPLSLNSRDTSADFLETASKHRSLDRSSIESSEPIKVERQENWEPVNLEIPAPELPPDIYLKPAGWLYHDLFLGSLADEQSGPYVHLSALQLFDLTTALDAYSHDDLADMPVRESRGLRGKPLVFAGLRTALTILVGIGAATGIVKLINHHHQNSASSPIPASTPQLLSPPPNLVVEQPLPTWQTPPPASAATPNLNVASNLPTIDTAPLPVPPPLFAAPPASPPGSIPDLAVEADGTMVIPANPEPIAAPTVAAVPAPQPVVPAPIPNTPPPISLPPQVIQLPTLENDPPPAVIPGRNVEDPAEVQARADLPNDSETQPTEPQSEELQPLNKRPRTLASQRQQDTSLFDQIPQVEEVRDYFQQAWYPPKSLNRALQYSLQLNADGSIQSITPVGQASLNQLPKLVLPSAGAPFVSPTQNSTAPKIRVVLEPGGRVQAFLESQN